MKTKKITPTIEYLKCREQIDYSMFALEQLSETITKNASKRSVIDLLIDQATGFTEAKAKEYAQAALYHLRRIVNYKNRLNKHFGESHDTEKEKATIKTLLPIAGKKAPGPTTPTEVVQALYKNSQTPMWGINKYCNPKKNSIYSQNLYRWLTYSNQKLFTNIFIDKDGVYYIGLLDNGFFHGCQLMRVLGKGAYAKAFCYPPKYTSGFKDITKQFWIKYLAQGKAAYPKIWWAEKPATAQQKNIFQQVLFV